MRESFGQLVLLFGLTVFGICGCTSSSRRVDSRGFQVRVDKVDVGQGMPATKQEADSLNPEFTWKPNPNLVLRVSRCHADDPRSSEFIYDIKIPLIVTNVDSTWDIKFETAEASENWVVVVFFREFDAARLIHIFERQAGGWMLRAIQRIDNE
jgi:hypothetical protein